MIEEYISNRTINLCDLLVDASIDRVMAIDTEWRIIAWNRTSEIVSGLSEKDLLHKPLLEVFPALKNDQKYLEALSQAMDGMKSFLPPDPEFTHRGFYETHIIPLKAKDGRLVGVMDLMHDVSHRIKAEQRLQKLNASLKDQYDQLEKANAELAIFTSVTTKDLKDPVRKLYTGLEMLVQADGRKLSDNSKAGLRRMQASLTKMNLLLEDILGFSSASSFEEKFVLLELDEILSGVLSSLQLKINDKKAVIEADHLPAYSGSKEMLHYLFHNLIDNALKFQQADNIPIIKIFSEVTHSRGDKDFPMLCITFTDNGIGFPAEDSKRIFNMFERLHSRKQFAGAGIGLNISKKITEAHGGHIEVESSIGNGSTFRCYLQIRS